MSGHIEFGDVFEYKFVDGGSAEPGTFEGYGAVFNNIDHGGDRILSGAFKESIALAESTKRMPKMLYQHGGLAGLGLGGTVRDLTPIGQWDAMAEDSHGLHVKGRLYEIDGENKAIYTAMRGGQLDGLSIGYAKPKFTRGTRAGEAQRTITNLSLKEISLVTFAMNELARTTAVKSLSFSIEELRALEAFLRESRNMSRTEAAKAISGLKEWLQRDVGAPASPPRDGDGIREAIAGPFDRLARFLRQS